MKKAFDQTVRDLKRGVNKKVLKVPSVEQKRVNDTGKNWRHVYKALVVLDYLVASGSERVIDEIREHAYQISTLSDFQYIDSSGKDQGGNDRKKLRVLLFLLMIRREYKKSAERQLPTGTNSTHYASTWFIFKFRRVW